jgi:gliding motility-associated-like protein
LLNVTGGTPGPDYSYLWSDNSVNRNLTAISIGEFNVTVTDFNGCAVTDSVEVTASNETCLIIPNAISPNDDGINDVWNIGNYDLYPELEIKIFNRWGETLWKSEKGYPKKWDGKSNGEILPIDSYHYIIDVHKGKRPIVGNITIVK